jgi:hypothetical protein
MIREVRMEMITQRALDDLRSTLRGDVLLPQDADYDATRRIFDAMIDKRPALIARCTSAADVVACIGFARAEAWRGSASLVE